jgi:pimeloyl-ACP methyl ester carboxylesterase
MERGVTGGGRGGELTFIEGAGGLRLAVDRWRNPAGQPVVLLHGGGQTRHAWGETAARLATAGYDVSSMDLRGHGDSGWCQEKNYGVDPFRDDLRAVLGQLARPAVLVGASLGGIAALAVAGEGPRERVKALVLVDITHSPPADGASRIQGFMRANPEGFSSLEEAAETVAAYLPHRPRPKDPSGLMKNLRLRDGRLHWHWDPGFLGAALTDRLDDPTRLEAAARSVEAPTLLVRGDESEIVSPQDADALTRLIPQARVVEIRGARHMVAGDQNTVFGTAVADFLAEVAPPHVAPVVQPS